MEGALSVLCGQPVFVRFVDLIYRTSNNSIVWRAWVLSNNFCAPISPGAKGHASFSTVYPRFLSLVACVEINR